MTAVSDRELRHEELFDPHIHTATLTTLTALRTALSGLAAQHGVPSDQLVLKTIGDFALQHGVFSDLTELFLESLANRYSVPRVSALSTS